MGQEHRKGTPPPADREREARRALFAQIQQTMAIHGHVFTNYAIWYGAREDARAKGEETSIPRPRINEVIYQTYQLPHSITGDDPIPNFSSLEFSGGFNFVVHTVLADIIQAYSPDPPDPSQPEPQFAWIWERTPQAEKERQLAGRQRAIEARAAIRAALVEDPTGVLYIRQRIEAEYAYPHTRERAGAEAATRGFVNLYYFQAHVNGQQPA